MQQLKVGDGVVRVVNKDGAGRKGNILEINLTRAKVYWLREKNGEVIRNSSGGMGVRTQVKMKELQKLPAPVDEAKASQEWDQRIKNIANT